MKFLYKFPTRSRPQKFDNCIKNIQENIADKNYKILVSIDDDDETMNDIISEVPDIIICKGKSNNKINAMNRDIEKVNWQWDILIATSDDMWFTQYGFDDIIRKDMAENFPDTNGVLHYNDGNQKDNVMTMSIIGRKYFDRFGYIYHPAYQSVWCDIEATEVAYMLGKYKYMGDEKIIFRHLHPAWGLAPYDEQYRKSENLDVWGGDLRTCIERKSANYGLLNSEIMFPEKYPKAEMEKWKNELNNARRNNNLQPINFY